MKNLRIFFFAATILFAASCDSSENCTQSDWVGTYTGTVNCDGTVTDADVTITASGSDAIVIEYVASDSTGSITTTYNAADFDGCSYSYTAEDSGLTLSVDATIDGDNLTLNEVITGNGTFTCNLTATRN